MLKFCLSGGCLGRPHSVDDDDVEQDASAELVVRYLSFP